MSKSLKELAFLRDLKITKDWTERFTDFADKHLTLPEEGSFLYFNAGTLSHALALREKLDIKVKLYSTCENAELQHIAEAKATAIKAPITFADLAKLEAESFDAVLADLSFTSPSLLSGILDELLFLTKKGGSVFFFLPTAGSFGEIFSFLWESFLDHELIEKGSEIERLISQMPTVSQIGEIARDAGMKEVETETSNEIFEYDSGEALINSTLLSEFLFPVWLDFLGQNEQKRVLAKLGQIIDKEHSNLTFRFSLKASFVSGKKR